MSDEIRPFNEKDNKIMAMMNDEALCPVLEESKVGVSDYAKLPVSRLAALGTAFEPLVAAVRTAVSGAGGSGLYYVDTAGKTMFQMNGTNNFIGSLKTVGGMVGGGQAQMIPFACDPTMLFMAAALANIDKKLDTIKEMQQEMMDFLIRKETTSNWATEKEVLQKNRNGFGRRNWIDPDKAITKKAMYCMAIESEVL